MHKYSKDMRILLVAMYEQLAFLTSTAQTRNTSHMDYYLGRIRFPFTKSELRPKALRQQKQELFRILDRLQEAHFNTVLLQTRLRGDVIYPSAYEGLCRIINRTYRPKPRI